MNTPMYLVAQNVHGPCFTPTPPHKKVWQIFVSAIDHLFLNGQNNESQIRKINNSDNE